MKKIYSVAMISVCIALVGVAVVHALNGKYQEGSFAVIFAWMALISLKIDGLRGDLK